MIDSANINVRGGDGGAGLVSFRREKYIPKGGPDGGDGGNGGNLIIKATLELNNLSDYARLRNYNAQDGESGGPKKMHGKNGKDLTLPVPVGTIIKSNGKLIADLVVANQEIVVAKGGKGGLGNVHFATSTNRTPREAEPGTPGQKLNIDLELKLIADIALVGLPNTGKSSLLRAITNAKPKIGDYPFSTLEPSLGVAEYKGTSFVAADIPGLIEGASAGKGLGDTFLKHIERTRVIVHLININSADPLADYNIIRDELTLYSQSLATKPEIIVFSQSDRIDGNVDTYHRKICKLSKLFKNSILISSVTRFNLDKLLNEIISKLSQNG